MATAKKTDQKERVSIPDAPPADPQKDVALAGNTDLAKRQESVEAGQISLPRIVLLQGSSNEVKRPEEPLRAGRFYNRLTKEELGNKLEVIPFAYFATRVALNVEQGLVCRSTDTITAQMKGGLTAIGEATDDCTVCVRKLWPNDRERETGETLQGKLATSGPECSMVNNFFALLVNGDDPQYYEFVVLQFMRTSGKAAADLKGLWLGSRRPLTSFHYVLTSRQATNKSNQTYYVTELGRAPGEQGKPKLTNEVEMKAVAEQLEFMKNKFSLDELTNAPVEESMGGDEDRVTTAKATAEKHNI